MNSVPLTEREALILAMSLGGMVHLIRSGQLGTGGDVPLPTADEIIAIREKLTPLIPGLQSLTGTVRGD